MLRLLPQADQLQLQHSVMLSFLLALSFIGALVCPSHSATLPGCYPSGVIPHDQPHTSNISPLPDRRISGTLPSSFPTSVLTEEAKTYYALFSNVLNVQGWAICPLQDDTSKQQPFPTPRGWSTVKVLSIKGFYDSKMVDVPTVVVIRDSSSKLKTSSCRRRSWATRGHLVILLRGSILDSDSLYSFDYSLIDAPEYGPGRIHKGAVNASNQVWNGLQQVLDEAFSSKCPPSHVTLAGHSLGAVGATLLAPRIARYIQQSRLKTFWKPHGRQPPLVSALLIGAPSVADATFAADFNRLVNGRKLEYDSDMYNTIFFGWMPDQSPPNLAFTRVGGVLRFGGNSMPYQTPLWETVSSTMMVSPDLQKPVQQATGAPVSAFYAWNGAGHTCSYLCKPGATINAVNNWCLLHNDTTGLAGKKATYCLNPDAVTPGNLFPTVPAYP